MNLEGFGLYLLYGIIAAGGVAMSLIMPRRLHKPRPFVLVGGVLGAATTGGIAFYWTGWIGAGFEGRGFVIAFGLVAVLASSLLITSRRPVYSVLYFLLVMMSVTGLCILGAAEFLGIALVIVYGGAILVTYLFVIMLAQQNGLSLYDSTAREPLAAVVVGFLLVAATTQAMIHQDPIATHAREWVESSQPRLPFRHRLTSAQGETSKAEESPQDEAPNPSAMNGEIGNVRSVGWTLMNHYVVAMEVAGLLLLVAMAGAILIARKRIAPEDLTPEEKALQQADVDIRKRGREAKPF